MLTEDDHKNLLFVQYDEEDRPFSVITAGATNDHNLFWSFEWSKAFGYSLYHMSGCGGDGSVEMSNFCHPIPPNRFWARKDVKLTRWVKGGKYGRRIPCTQKAWEKMGNLRIPKPLVADPFVDAVEAEAVYCQTCNDYFPGEEWNTCKHLAWCDKCGWWVHVLPSGHIRLDGPDRQRRMRHAPRSGFGLAL